MKRLVIFLCTLALVTWLRQPAQLQAHAISESALEITTDTTWEGNKAIIRDVVIKPGATLTILAGSFIFFNVEDPERPPRIIADGGRIRILGTAAAPVTLSSLKQSLEQAGSKQATKKGGFVALLIGLFGGKPEHERYWGGIHLRNCGKNGSLIQFARIEYAKNGIVLQNSSPRIENTHIEGCKLNGIESTLRSNPEIIACTITQNKIAGIHIETESAPIIRQTTISHSPKAVVARQCAPQIFTNNRIEDCETGLLYRFPRAQGPITGNTFVRNLQAIVCEQNASPLISQNTFTDNKKAIVLQKMSLPLIIENVFSQNEYAITCLQNSSPVITKNSFIQNGIDIYCHFASYPNIRYNSFVGTSGYVIKLGQQSAELYRKLRGSSNRIGFGALRTTTDNGPKQGQHIPSEGSRFGQAPPYIDARHNYWPASTRKQFAAGQANIEHIWDYYDQPSFEYEGASYRQDTVNYQSWLIAPPQLPIAQNE